jgi:copper chaperone CopZ
MMRLIIEIKGMECEGCKVRINRLLKKMKGILNVNIELKEGKAYVDVDNRVDLANIEREIRNKINGAGYLVGEIKELES